MADCIIPIRDDKHWHELRAKHIGGSDVAALFGASSYNTPYDLYHQRRGTYHPPEAGLLAEFGNVMEPIIAAYIAEEYHWRLVQCKDYMEHPDHRHLGCTLDYYVVESEHGAGILEIKNVQQFSPGWTKERAPDYVEWQVQHQLLVASAARKAMGLPPFTWAAIGSMHAGNPEDIRIMMRKPDPKAHNAIIQRTTKFWDDVQQGNEPPITGGQDYEAVAGIFEQSIKEEEAVLDMRGNVEMDKLLDTYAKKKEEERLAGSEAKKIKTMIMHNMMQEGVAYMSTRTDHYTCNIKQSVSMRKAQPAKEVTTIRFNVKFIEE